MSSRRLLFALALPMVVLLAWVLRLAAQRHQGREVVLDVQAYDPRDLLAGHYLQYAIDYGSNPCDGIHDPAPMCVCLDPTTGPAAKATWSGQCSGLPSECATHLRGSCEYSRFTAGIERYYIPESYTSKLTQVPPDSTIVVRVTSEGQALVQEFKVGGVSLAEFLAQQR